MWPSLREWYEKNGRREVTVEEPTEPKSMSQAKRDKQLRQLLCFWEKMKESPELLTTDNTPFPGHAVEGIKQYLYALRIPIPERLVVKLTPLDKNAREAVLTKLKRDTACLKLSEVKSKKPISSIVQHCMKKWPLEREFGVDSLSLFPRHATQRVGSSLHWSLHSADLVVDVARAAGIVEDGTLELHYGWNAPAPDAPPPAASTDAPKNGCNNNLGSSPPVTEPAMPRPEIQQDVVEGVQVSGLEGVHLGAAFDAVASTADGKPILATSARPMSALHSTAAAAVDAAVSPTTGDTNAPAGEASPGEAAAALLADSSARKRSSVEQLALPNPKRPARFAGSEAAVLEMGAAARRVSLSHQTQEAASGTAVEPSALSTPSSGCASGFDANRWAANARAAASAAASSASDKSGANRPADSGLSVVQPSATSASNAADAASSIFGREDSLPVHRLDLDEGISLGAIGVSRS